MNNNILLLLIALVLALILIISVTIKDLLDRLLNKDKRSIIITVILIGGILSLVFSFFAPYFFTSTDIGKTIITTQETGLIGDTKGGIMNPFITTSGILLTFLAFYIQYQANQQVQDQFKLQQFESQFYEMMRMHKDNIKEMKIEGYEYSYKEDNSTTDKKISKERNKKDTTGRKIFVTMNQKLILVFYNKKM